MAWPDCNCIGCVYREIAQRLDVGLFSAWGEWPEKPPETTPWVMVVRQPRFAAKYPLPTGTILERKVAEMTPYRNCVIDPNGAILRAEDFPDLYRVIGERYGRASTGTFKVPDMRARVVRSAQAEAGEEI